MKERGREYGRGEAGVLEKGRLRSDSEDLQIEWPFCWVSGQKGKVGNVLLFVPIFPPRQT